MLAILQTYYKLVIEPLTPQNPNTPENPAMTRTIRPTEVIARETLEGSFLDLMDCAANDNNLAAWHAARKYAQDIEDTCNQVIRTFEARNYEQTQFAGLTPVNRAIAQTLWNGGAA